MSRKGNTDLFSETGERGEIEEKVSDRTFEGKGQCPGRELVASSEFASASSRAQFWYPRYSYHGHNPAQKN